MLSTLSLELGIQTDMIITPTLQEIRLYFSYEGRANSCHLDIVFTHQWWEMGLYWATWGLPYADTRTIDSLKNKYTIADYRQRWRKKNQHGE